MKVTEGDLLEALAQEMALPPLLPDDVTAMRLAERTGKHSRTCYNWLEIKVKAGELVKVKCRAENYHAVMAYRKPE